MDELDGEDEVQLPSRTPSLSPSPTFASFSTELARLHPLLAECAAHLSKAGLPDLATLRSLTRTELASFLGDVEGITALQRTLLMGRAASEDA